MDQDSKHPSSQDEQKGKDNTQNSQSIAIIVEAAAKEYARQTETYDKVYQRAIFALAACGIFMAAMARFVNANTVLSALRSVFVIGVLGRTFFLATSFLMLLVSMMLFLWLLRGKRMEALGVELVENLDVEKWGTIESYRWLKDGYIKAIKSIKINSSLKQKQYNRALSVLLISLVLFAISFLLQEV
jgi:hypothetical protein